MAQSKSKFIKANFDVGTLHLGQIIDVRQKYLVVCFTQNKKGFVSIDQSANSDLTEFYQKGQFLNCVIIKSDGQIQCSLKPKIVNAGLLKQDIQVGMCLNGYVQEVVGKKVTVDVEISGVSCYTKKLEAGCVKTFVVKKIKKKSIQLKVLKQNLKQQAVKSISNIQFLKPGMITTGKVKSANANYLTVQILKHFTGQIMIEQTENFTLDKNADICRVIQVDLTNRQILLSTKEKILKLNKTICQDFPAHLKQSAKVLRVQGGFYFCQINQQENEEGELNGKQENEEGKQNGKQDNQFGLLKQNLIDQQLAEGNFISNLMTNDFNQFDQLYILNVKQHIPKKID